MIIYKNNNHFLFHLSLKSLKYSAIALLITTVSSFAQSSNLLSISNSSSSDIIVNENFEDNKLDSTMSIETIGSFSSYPGIKNITNFGSQRAFGFGLSTCGASCFDAYTSILVIKLPMPIHITEISFKEMELYSNWGSAGRILIDGAYLTNNPFDFSRSPYNDWQADGIYRQKTFTVDKKVSKIEFRVSDITRSSEVFIDDLLILGLLNLGRLRISSISPDRGGDGGTISVTIRGELFQQNAQVNLVKEDQLIIGENTKINEAGTVITTSFNLTDQEQGFWDLMVINPDSSLVTSKNGFTIEETIERLWVDILGRDQIRVGSEATFMIPYGNSGNVTEEYPWLVIYFPATINYKMDIPWAIPHLEDNATYDPESIKLILIDLTPLQPGCSESIEFSVLKNDNKSFNINALITTDVDRFFKSWYDLVSFCNKDMNMNNLLKPETDDGWDENWQHEIDLSNEPPPGWVMMWKYPKGSKYGFHIAKSLGNGDFIEMNLGNPALRKSRVSENWNYYLGALRPPTDSPEHRLKIQIKADFHLQMWGEKDKSERGEGICLPLPLQGKLIANCMGYFLILNDDFVQHNKTQQDVIWDYLRPTDPLKKVKRWDEIEPQIIRYEGNFVVRRENINKILTSFNNEASEICELNPEDLDNSTTKGVQVVQSWDPNVKAGLVGFGSEHFVSLDQNLEYIIYFENADSATASTEFITIKDTLSKDLDMATFSFGAVSHPDSSHQCTYDSTKGIISWRFDMALPPNKKPPEGEGFVSYSIRPKSNLTSGTVIKNRASIVFDYNKPILTDYVINTIDATPPTSRIKSLAPEQSLSQFLIEWDGNDDFNGSDIREFTIYVSDNNGKYKEWITTEKKSATFKGENNHSYQFYSIARDNVGNIEPKPQTYDATTIVKLLSGIAVSPNPFVPSRGHEVISFFGDAVAYSKIKIFDFSGELVKTLEERDGNDRLDWYAANENGEKLASGVYIWIAATQNGKQEKGKLAIIK